METTKLVQAFKSELNLTDQGLLELTKQKKGLVIDVTTEEGFKLARKERTEQNKLLKNIDDLAIGGKRSVDEARNVLKDRVSEIYAPTVTAFEAENIRRKEAERIKKEAEEKRVQAIRDQINSIRQFATNLFGKSSEELQRIIEAVDMIDVSESFAELTQEAMVVKKETLSELNQALSSAIQSEQLEAEREKLRQEREVQEEKNRINELKAKAQERLNTLIMIPSGFFGKSSDEINRKIHSLINCEIKEEEFGELFDQANASEKQVIQQLNMMFDQQIMIEKAQETEQQAEADRIAQIKANDAELQKRDQLEKMPVEQLDERSFLNEVVKLTDDETFDCKIPHDCLHEIVAWADLNNISVEAVQYLEMILNKYFA
jgi:hypothetical protein